MTKLCAFDVETRGKSPEFVCGSIFSDEAVEYHTNPSEMIERLRWHARKSYKLIAHHAEYDIGTLLWPAGEDVSIRYANNQYTTASWRYGDSRRTCTIWDNMRLCAGLSLKELGDAIGCPKMDTPRRLLDPTDIRKDWYCETHRVAGCIECYCVRDAEIVWSYANALSEWLGSYGLSLHYSLARSAIDLWQLLDPGMSQVISSARIRSLARQAYHGGRCEVFQYGNVGRVYTGDFRSFYGSILRQVELPSIPRLRYDSGEMGILVDDSTDGVISATVHCDSQHVPPLPARYHERTYYPVGRFNGVWSLRELRNALDHGVTVEHIDEMYWTDQLITPFIMTANVLIERRESLRNQHDAREIACKYMLNAIPGRLGMREETELVSYRRWRHGHDSESFDGAELERVGRDLFLARRHSLSKPGRTSNVMWAASINSEGRIRLYDKLLQAGGDVLYCDTDSVHSHAPLDIEGDVSGMFRDTGVYDSGIYLGSKFYSLETDDGKTDSRAKGIPRAYAREFIKNRHIAYQTAFGVVDGILRGVSPCVWVDTERVAAYAPGTRTIVTPEVLDGRARQSDTVPVVFGSVGSDLPNVTYSEIDCVED